MTHLPSASATRPPLLALFAAFLLSLAGAAVQPALAAAGPTADLSSTFVNFGYVQVGTVAERTVTLTNNGDAPLVISSSIMSTNTQAITVSTSSTGNLAAGASRTITVRFAPTGPVNASAVLTTYSNAPGQPRQIQVAGVGAQPVLTTSGYPYGPYFGGNVAVGASATGYVTVSNNGNAPLIISAVTVAGPDAARFTVNAASALATPIQQYGSRTISVTFTPDAPGARTASLQITSNSTTPVTVVPLNATGV